MYEIKQKDKTEKNAKTGETKSEKKRNKVKHHEIYYIKRLK